MPRRTLISVALVGSLGLAPLTGCENLPGGKKEQGAVIGGAGGALAGSAVAGKGNRTAGALIGGLLGAGGGYLIGAQMKKNDASHKDEATTASQRAQTNPVTADEARRATTADVNNDGYVTLDEVAAMQKANLSDAEMINRLRATGQVFQLTTEQETYLRDRGVDQRVLTAMRDMNQDTGARRASDTIDNRDNRGSDTISNHPLDRSRTPDRATDNDLPR
jgi:surface antigen